MHGKSVMLADHRRHRFSSLSLSLGLSPRYCTNEVLQETIGCGLPSVGLLQYNSRGGPWKPRRVLSRESAQLNDSVSCSTVQYSELTDPGQSQVRYRNAIRNTMRNQ